MPQSVSGRQFVQKLQVLRDAEFLSHSCINAKSPSGEGANEESSLWRLGVVAFIRSHGIKLEFPAK
jgi:hypothetical protein